MAHGLGQALAGWVESREARRRVWARRSLRVAALVALVTALAAGGGWLNAAGVARGGRGGPDAVLREVLAEWSLHGGLIVVQSLCVGALLGGAAWVRLGPAVVRVQPVPFDRPPRSRAVWAVGGLGLGVWWAQLMGGGAADHVGCLVAGVALGQLVEPAARLLAEVHAWLDLAERWLPTLDGE